MTKPAYTHIHVLFDRSGSMAGREEDVNGWYKTFVAEQKKGAGECTFSLATFDSNSYDTVIPWRNIQEVPSDFRLLPRGGTPLFDAVGRSINELGARLASMNESDRPSKVIVIVQTDGEENASREYTLSALKSLVDRQRQVYNWDFMFLGADIDAFGVGAAIGIARGATATYGNNSLGYKSMAVASAAAINRSRDLLSVGILENVTYSQQEQDQMQATVDNNLPSNTP